MKKNWEGYFLVVYLGTVAGIMNNNFGIMEGAIFGLICGCLFGLFILFG